MSYTAEQGNPLDQDFQSESLSIENKSDEGYGLAIAKSIESHLSSDYYERRNDRFKRNRDAAAGRLNMEKFMDLLGFDRDEAKPNFANLNWNSIRIINRVIGGLIGRWMSRNEKLVFTAVDPLSIDAKRQQYEEMEYYVYNRERMMQLQMQSGVQIMPNDIPEDQQGLHLWATQIQKLPEEICFQMGCNDVLAANGFFTINKEKLLRDSAITGFVGTYTEMDEDGVVTIAPVTPENAIYSDSVYDDFRDTTYRGQVKSLKISHIRRKYPNLSEEEICEIASLSTDNPSEDKIAYSSELSVSGVRPYDEWSIDVIDFEIKLLDVDMYVEAVTKKNQSTLLNPGAPEGELGENETLLEEEKFNIYRGVYVRGTDIMLEWGLKDNMIRPNDPKELGNAEFSYSFYMDSAYEMRNIAVPEKVEEPAEQMILARLKMQQLVSKMIPVGAQINIDALQELDLGLGKKVTPIEAQKIWEQTGKLYYRGRDAQGNPLPVPIQELANAGFMAQMEGLIATYNFHYQIFKDELGEDPNMITQAMQPRVAAANVQASQNSSENATDYMYRAFLRVMEDTAKKVACLIQDSVEYGASAYRALLKQEDVRGRYFSCKAQMLPTEHEIAKLEVFINEGIRSNPDLIQYINPWELIRVAKEDVKLAESLFYQGQKRMLQHRQAIAEKNQQDTINGQIQSAIVSEEAKRKTKEMEGQVEMIKAQTTGDASAKQTILSGVMQMYQKSMETGTPLPADIAAIARAVLENVALPAMLANEEQKLAIIQKWQEQEANSQPPQQGAEQSIN